MNATGHLDEFRRLREERGLSQKKLARLADCSISMIRRLETGYRPAAGAVLDRVREVLQDENDEGLRRAKPASGEPVRGRSG